MSRSARALLVAVLTSLVILSPSAALYAQKASKLKGADAPASKQGSTQRPGKVKGERDAQPATKGQAGGGPSDSKISPKPVEGRLTKARTFDGDLRDLPAVLPLKRERPEREGPEPNPREFPGTSPATPQTPAQPEAATISAPAPTPLATFDGLDFATWGAGHPPDTNGDVGPTYYIQTVNTSIGIFRKSDGVRVAAFTFNTFMSQGSFGNLCDTDNFGDPVVLYDTFEDRWVITDFAFKLDASQNVINPPGAFQCFAVSKTGDPVSGGWNYYSINTTGGLGDYPKLGVWPDGIYMSVNMFDYAASGAFQNSRVYAFNKAQMYAGAPTVQSVSFDAPPSEFTLLPSNARLQTGTPPPGSPNYFAVVWNFLNSAAVYKFHVDWNSISTSSLTGPFNSTMAFWWEQYDRSGTDTAPSPANNLDTLYPRLMVQNQYSNIGGAESLWLSHTVGAGNPTSNLTSTQSAVRYYQLNVTGGTVAANTVQSFTYSPDATLYRYMPSVAVDRAGNMAIGYTTSNATTNPALKFAGRLAGDAANSITQTEQTMFQGTGTQSGNCGSSTCERWGDYSAMSLDPDGCTFWYTNEYYATTGLNDLTRIGSFRLPGCTVVGSGGTVSGTVTDSSTSNPIAGATVALGSRTTTTNASGGYSFSGLPAGTYPTITASSSGYGSSTQTSVAVTDGGTTTKNFSLTAAPSNACPNDTSQADFQTGVPTNVDLTSTPGSAILSDTPAVDQQNTNTTTSGFGFSNTSWVGQTFTPAVTGQATTVAADLFCSSCTGTPPNVVIAIRNSSSNLPTGSDLASVSVPFSNSGAGGFVSGTFASPPTLTAGTQYAIVVRMSASYSTGTPAYAVSSGSTYAGGRRVTSSNSGSSWTGQTNDIGFKVTVKTGFKSPGNLVSGAKDANPAAGFAPIWSTLSWTATTPASTGLTFQLAGSNSIYGPFNFVGPDGTSGTTFSNGASIAQFNGLRYLKYKAALTTTNSAATPSLNDVTICFTNVSGNALARDAQAAEPASGQTTMLFTVALSSPAVAPITVDYATADQAAGAGHAVGGASCNGTNDYLSIPSGTLNFAAGEQLKTVPVNVCSDSVPSEPDETFVLNLSNASGALITRAQATGTIRQANTAGSLLVSELRESGPGGAGDDFIELYNNSDSQLTVADGTGILDNAHGYGVFKTGATCAAAPALVAVVPNGTTIPARGHYLIAGTAYSLGSSAAGNQTLAADVENDRSLAVFSTADLTQLSTVTRLDAAGFSANTGGLCDLLGERGGLASAAGSTSEYSFFRKLASGTPQDTNDNASDFMLVSTTPATAVGSTASPALGAPGPENSTSPVNRGATIKPRLFDLSASASDIPNRDRDTTLNNCGTASPAGNCAFGTLTARRNFTNNTGATVTKLRFRVVDVTTATSPGGGVADVRLLSSPLAVVNGQTVAKMDIETPTQANGGGYNSTIVATLPGTLPSPPGIAPGDSINVQFVLGVQTTGNFRFFVIVEGLP